MPTNADWPTLLGNPQRAGYAAEAAPDSVEEVWRAEVGRGLVSPLVVEGPAVLAATANRLVVAISAEDGEHYWERRLDGAITGGMVRWRDRVFAAAEEREGRAYALALEDGDRLWHRVVGSTPVPPLLVGDVVFFGTEGGNIFALDVRKGEEAWKRRLSGAVRATPVPWHDRLLVATASDTLFVLDRDAGAVVGRMALPAGVAAAPALSGDTVVVPLFSGDAVALVLPELTQAWRAALGAPVLAAPVVAPNGAVYLLTRAADLWRVPPAGGTAEKIAALGGAARASLTLVRDRLLVGRLDGTLFLLRTDGSVVWRKDLEDSIVAPVTAHAGALYVPLLRGTIVKLQ
ncbi:MAG: PQQ-binding-like beta-propeller repeat protein [Gemmatimonadetes bacterium]|nr:PQQ-binding-like beta-propeller repeat protein [Gemmatimonadota bacterium]